MGEARSRLISKAQAAAMLAISERTVDRMLQRGELPGLKLGGQVRIPETAVLAILEKGAAAHA